MKGIHGGDIYRNDITIDFSININPLGIPGEVKEALHRAAEKCSRYPDMEAAELKKAVSNMLKVPEQNLLFGNGASELFMAVVHGIKPERTVIPVPSFFGYEYAAKAGEGSIVFYETKEENAFSPGEDFFNVLTEEVGLLFLANPNNPTGKLLGRRYLKKLLAHCRDRNIYVVLDECFIEFCSRDTLMLLELERFDNLILVRAFTKIFSVPGVRLGYLVCSNQRVIQKIKRQIPEWNLSVPAQEAGCACAGQAAYIKETKEYVEKEKKLFIEGLRRLGIQVVSGEANFIFLYSEEPLYEALLKRGILIRDCGNFRGLKKGFYRIAVKSRQENEFLLKMLGEIDGNRKGD